MPARLVSTTLVPETAKPLPSPPANAGAENIKRHNVEVKLMYLADDPLYQTVKPLQITPNFADKERRSNVLLTPGEVEVLQDVRGLGGHELGPFSLDEHGFSFVKAPTKLKDWTSQPKIAQEYLPELESVLREHVSGCDEILFYDARLRQEGDEGLRVEGLSYNPFARQVHTDNTERSVIDKIHNLTEMKADYLLSGRCRIINIWRPIKHPVYDCGLTIADGGGLQEDDVMECDRHRADTGEYWDTMGVIRYRPGFKWYYCSEQAEEDVLLFKNYDSATNVKARWCLHSAFDMPPDSIPPNTPTRESIEVRALVFTYPKSGRRPSMGYPLEHPLATSLQQGGLKRLVDEEHTIEPTRVRTDIDEGKEIKDAVLLLRKQEIKRLEKVQDALTAERDELLGDLMKANSERDEALSEARRKEKQVRIQSASIEALQAEVKSLKGELALSHPDLRQQINSLSRKVTDARLREATRLKTEADGHGSAPAGYDMSFGRERASFIQTLERQEREIQKWKGEAMGKGNETITRCWQASVDEAVRKEREKDAFVFQAMKAELEALKGSNVA